MEEGIVDSGGGAGLIAEEGLGIGGSDVDFDYCGAEVCQEGGLESYKQQKDSEHGLEFSTGSSIHGAICSDHHIVLIVMNGK